jgi:hypothetical protein
MSTSRTRRASDPARVRFESAYAVEGDRSRAVAVDVEPRNDDVLNSWLRRARVPDVAGRPKPDAAGGLRFAFYGRVSTAGFQERDSSRRWQRDVAADLIAGHGRIVVEFFDVDRSRRLPWRLRPQAAALLASLADRRRTFDEDGGLDLRILESNELLICDLAEHDPIDGRRYDYHLGRIECPRTADGTVIRAVAKRTRSPPRRSPRSSPTRRSGWSTSARRRLRCAARSDGCRSCTKTTSRPRPTARAVDPLRRLWTADAEPHLHCSGACCIRFGGLGTDHVSRLGRAARLRGNRAAHPEQPWVAAALTPEHVGRGAG